MKNVITGRYRDLCRDHQGRTLWDSGWRNNLVVQPCNLLLAALMKGEVGIDGIRYWAIGTGRPEWDRRTPSPVFTDTQLSNEVARIPLDLNQIVYIDDQNEVSESATNRLEITASFDADALGFDGTQALREFGLFGGNASETANSGFMIDFIIHPRYDLSLGSTLTRSIHLTFANASPPQDEWMDFGAALPVISIDGVGIQFASALNGANVNTISQLLQIDPLQSIATIPAVKLREFRAKARFVLAFRADLNPFVSLAQHTISEVLKSDPETLFREINSATVTIDSLMRLQETLATLQVALDDMVLQELTLGDLAAS